MHPPDPSQQFPPLPAYRVLRQAHAGERAGRRTPRSRARCDDSAAPASRASRSAGFDRAHCALRRSRAMAGCISSCRRPRRWRTISNCWRQSRPRRSAQSAPVVIEGYEPPRDPRLTHLRVTPDPGVIEVNVHPARAGASSPSRPNFSTTPPIRRGFPPRNSRLDGRHTGTGGGNHFVLGGATPGDSPFLRRPDLLASMIAYWHNHPSLSYFFSGQYIGPTSQAPRVDEARNDAVYELELALRELKRMQGAGALEGAPWQVDRALRNVLVDVTGNTHRAEFCIDKLFSPEGGTGRLGLLELRAFEMPPHARMSLAQLVMLPETRWDAMSFCATLYATAISLNSRAVRRRLSRQRIGGLAGNPPIPKIVPFGWREKWVASCTPGQGTAPITQTSP